MSTRPVAVVLGGTPPHISLINNLRKRGYSTLLIDYLPDPPAKQSADQHLQVSTLDVEAVFDVARSSGASLVISACVDQANLTACLVSERLGLPHPYGPDVAQTVTDKKLMKRRMSHYGIPTSRYVVVSNPEQLSDIDLTYPLIVKPCDGNGSKGVRRVSDSGKLHDACGAAIRASRSGEAIVEEFVEGKQIDVICYLGDSNFELLMVRHRLLADSGNNDDSVMQYVQSLIPAGLTAREKESVAEVIAGIQRAFCLSNTMLQAQLIMGASGPSVIEFAPRVGGGLSFITVPRFTGVDPVDLTVDSYLKRPREVRAHTYERCISENNLYARAGRLGAIKGLKELEGTALIWKSLEYKRPGDELAGDLSSRDRVAAFILEGRDHAELLETAKRVRQAVDIVDADGNSIFRTDLYA